MTRRTKFTSYAVLGIILVVALALGIALSDHGDAPTLPANLPEPAKGHHWQLKLDEEFDGKKLDNNKLITCYDSYVGKPYNGCANSGNSELEWYTRSQVSVHDGSAWLTAITKSTIGTGGNGQLTFPYQSGMISTGRSTPNGKPKQTFKYGYFEARIKAPSGQGLMSAFQLLPASDGWPPEIDIMEILGNQPNKVLMTYHYGSAASPVADESAYPSLNNPTGWHTYAVDWEPGKITWYIDGVVQKSVASPNVPSTPMELLLDLAVGGSLPGSPDNTTHFPASMQVDYVRVYQQ